MPNTKIKTYTDKLLENRDFKARFEQEYENLVISQNIAALRHKADLTQDELAKKIHTTRSAISRYESNSYRGYSIALLKKIAHACGADLRVSFVHK